VIFKLNLVKWEICVQPTINKTPRMCPSQISNEKNWYVYKLIT